nr:glycine receptor subunit alpha-3-like [Procambarus clarkii]
MDLFLHMTWEDSRLNLSNLVFISGRENENNYITLPAYAMEHIWTPDPYVINAKDSVITTLTTTYASITLYDNKTIRYSSRISSTIACQMVFHDYPMDIQKCFMIMRSFMYSPNEVKFNWRKFSPVMLNKELKLLQFSLKKPLNNYVRNVSFDELGHGERDVRQLVLELEFSREIGHHLVQTFVPSFLVVALSWFSFWMDLDAIPGRVTLVVTSLLTLTTLFTGIKEGLPPVAYVKAIDVWMAGCMVFIFSALGEFIIVKWLNSKNISHMVGPGFTPPAPPHTRPPDDLNFSPRVDHHIKRPPDDLNFSPRVDHHIKRLTVISSSHGGDPDTLQRSPRSVKLTEKDSAGDHLTKGVIGPGGPPVPAWAPEQPGMAPFPRFHETLSGRLSLQWFDPQTGEKKILWKEIDKASRVVFPLMFLFFMLIYFPILVFRAF